jgi:pyruvate kinase
MGDTDTRLIAKIEDYEGVQNFDTILEKVDAIMVARGDLGVELPIERVPMMQKEFVKKCRQAGKPVIVATQMLESMRENLRPTRAEVADIANAVIDGADAIMLSAETSSGKFPAQAVDMMRRTSFETEKNLPTDIVRGRTIAKEETDFLGYHICELIAELKLSGVIAISTMGKTIGTLARHRLNMPIWCLTANPKLSRQVNLARGIKSIYVQDFPTDRDEIITKCVNNVYEKGEIGLDARVLVISGNSLPNHNLNSIIEIVNVKDIVVK